MERVSTSDLSTRCVESIFRAACFGERTRCPENGYPGKSWRLDDEPWRCCKQCRKRFAVLTDTPLARERCSLPEIYELLDGINLGLTDQNISGRVQMRYHRGHPFFLKRKRAIHGFE